VRRRLLPHAAGSIPMLPSAAPSPFAAPGFAKLPCSLLQSQLGLSSPGQFHVSTNQVFPPEGVRKKS